MATGYYVTFSTKHRGGLLTPDIRPEVRKVLMDKAAECGRGVRCMEVLPDHVHMYIIVPEDVTLSAIVGQLKGYSSFMFRKAHPDLKGIKSLWGKAYYSKEVDSPEYARNLMEYIRTQYEHHNISKR